jgi:inhibitor of cysteine peptidase
MVLVQFSCSNAKVTYKDTDEDGDGEIEISGTLTIFTSNEELAAYLKDQYSKSVFSDYSYALAARTSGSSGLEVPEGAGSAAESSYDSLSSNDTDSYTGTNIQEAGVDESDVVKTDGDYLYIAGNDTVAVVSAATPMKIVSKITVNGSIDSMYLYITENGKRLLALLYTPLNYEGTPWLDSGTDDTISTGIAYWVPIKAKTGVAVYDITSTSAPEEIRTLEADGYLVSSRRVGNHLHVVQQFLPELPDPYSLEKEIKDMTLEELMPYYSDVTGGSTGGMEKQLISPQNFYHPSYDGGGSIVSIMTFDLDDPYLTFTSTGVVADASVIYASTEALYCTSSYWNYSGTGSDEPAEQTIIYKFDISGDQVTGQGYSGVDGRALNQFSLGEYEGVLRIATTTGWSWGTEAASKNHVYCLKSQNGKLGVIGRLEDIAQGEELYSARFIGPRGYLVTFVTIDPLFTLDLSDPYNPEMVGELKVPGYSTYIHPWGDDHLITIGKDAIEDEGFAWYQGVQLSIFDISDFANPKLVKSGVIGDRGTHSEALYNHKAFTFWESEGLMALPIDLYELQGAQSTPYDYGELTFKGLYVYRISTEVEDVFKLLGKISTLSVLDEYGYYYNDWTRGIFIDDKIYAVTEEAVRSAEIIDIEGTIQSLTIESD